MLCQVPASLIHLGGPSIPLPHMLTSKKLDGTVIIADCSTRLCAALVGTSEAEEGEELLIEPDKTPSYYHGLLEPCDRRSEELHSEVCLERMD
jgi:hypothetical protein